MIKSIVSKIIKFFNLISFWVFIYVLLVIIHLHFHGIGAYVIMGYYEFSIGALGWLLYEILWISYSPLYIISFLSVSWIKKSEFFLKIKSESLKKFCLYSIPLFISLLLFFFNVVGGIMAETPISLAKLFLPTVLFQILAVIIFAHIYAQNKENIILPKISKFVFIFILGAIIYLAGFVYYGSQLPLVIRDLTKKAVETKDPFFCEEIIKEGEKRGKVRVSPGVIERCFEKIIKVTKNPKICDEVKNEEARNHCFKIAAFSLNDPQLCERMTKTTWQGVKLWDDCFLKLAQELNTLQLCKKLEIEWNKADCFHTLVLQLNNPEICYKIVEYDWQPEWCLEEISALNNPELCEKRETYLQDECFEMVAIYSKNPQLCEKAGDSNKCLKEVAIYSKDPQLCEKIKAEPKWPLWYRDTCFETLAYKLNKPELCEKIMEKQQRKWCLDKFE